MSDVSGRFSHESNDLNTKNINIKKYFNNIEFVE